MLAATNRPDMLDPAMCRPGRLDKLLYVDLPAPEERAEIMRTLLAGSRRRCRVPLLSPGVVEDVARMMESPKGDDYSGADLAALVREAGVRALRRALGTLEEMEGHLGPSDGAVAAADDDAGEVKGMVVLFEDFQAALGKVAPSVSKAQRRRYEALRETFASGVGRRENKERVV
jgi:ribosome biogenesis ATPase